MRINEEFSVLSGALHSNSFCRFLLVLHEMQIMQTNYQDSTSSMSEENFSDY